MSAKAKADWLKCAGFAGFISHGTRYDVEPDKESYSSCPTPEASVSERLPTPGASSRIPAGLSRTIVMVAHDLPYAHELCERALVIDGGRIAADGPTSGLLAAHDLDLPRGFVTNHH